MAVEVLGQEVLSFLSLDTFCQIVPIKFTPIQTSLYIIYLFIYKRQQKDKRHLGKNFSYVCVKGLYAFLHKAVIEWHSKTPKENKMEQGYVLINDREWKIH